MAANFFRSLIATGSFILLFLQSNSQQQDNAFLPVQKIKLKNISIDDGLSQGNISRVLQDKTGYLWIGTADGLNRYDGYTFTIYRNETDSQSISSNNIKKLFEDDKGRLWISFAEGGLDLYDKISGKFIHIIPIENRRITTDPDGFSFLSSYGNGVLILRNRQFYRVDLDTLTTTAAAKQGKSFFFQPHIRQLNAAKNSGNFLWGANPDVYLSANRRIWMLDGNSSLFEVKIDTVLNEYSFFEHTVPAILIPPKTSKVCRPFYVVDNFKGLIYFQQYSNIYRLEEKTGAMELFMKNTTLMSYLPNTVDYNGNIWLNNYGQLYFINVTERKGWYIESSDIEIQKKNVSTTASCYLDRIGNIWVCTLGYGLMKINLDNTVFRHIKREIGINFSSKRISKSLNGNLYVIPWEGEDCLFDTIKEKLTPNPVQFTQYSPSSFVAIKKGHRIPLYPFLNGSGTIPSRILNDENYFLRISMNNKELYVVDPSKDFVATIYREQKEPVVGPYLSTPAHTVWFAAEGKYLRSLDLLTGEHINIPLPAEAGLIRETIARDLEGNIWLSTEHGICKYNTGTRKWKTYFEKNTADGLRRANVLCFLFAPGDPEYVWIGFEGKGLCKMNIANGTCVYYTVENGLPNNVVYGILQDKSGILWISTNNGLSAFDIKANRFRNFTYQDGLQSNEFNRYSFAQTASGDMLFGGVNGLTFFKPPELKGRKSTDNIWLTDMLINNKTARNRTDIAVSQFSLPGNAPTIKLNYDENVIAFRFASSDITAPQQNQFSYKLEGIDENWSIIGTDHNAVYTYLPPNDYIFRVKGFNRDGMEAGNEISFPFTINPPWWKTWWFRTLIILTVLAIIYALYRYRLNQVIRLHTIRNRISADMHDEIGSTLSSISFYSQALLMQSPDDKQRTVLEKIKDNAQIVQEGLSDIIWSVKADMDSFENLLIRMQRIANELLEPKNISFHFEADEKLKQLKVEMIVRKNFYLIFKEALHNAAKYAQCKNVWVNVTLNKHNILMTIKDDGQGFDPKTVNNGNGLGNMQQRAADIKGDLLIQSRPGEGTEVRIFLKALH